MKGAKLNSVSDFTCWRFWFNFRLGYVVVSSQLAIPTFCLTRSYHLRIGIKVLLKNLRNVKTAMVVATSGGQVVRTLDYQSRGPEFKSQSGPKVFSAPLCPLNGYLSS